MNITTVDWLLSQLPHLSELQAYDLAEGVAERLPTSTGWDEVKRLRAKLTDASPGTPLGRLKGLARYAEEHLGHSPVSARPAEVLVLEEIERLRAIVEKLPKTADGVFIYPGCGITMVWSIADGGNPYSLPLHDIDDDCWDWPRAEEIQIEDVAGFVDCLVKCYSTRKAAEAAGEE